MVEFMKWNLMMGQLPDLLANTIAAVDACVTDFKEQEVILGDLDISVTYKLGGAALSGIKTYLEQDQRNAEGWRDAADHVGRSKEFRFIDNTAVNVVNGTRDLEKRIRTHLETLQALMTTLDNSGAARLASLDELHDRMDWLLVGCGWAVAHSEDFSTRIKEIMRPRA